MLTEPGLFVTYVFRMAPRRRGSREIAGLVEMEVTELRWIKPEPFNSDRYGRKSADLGPGKRE